MALEHNLKSEQNVVIALQESKADIFSLKPICGLTIQLLRQIQLKTNPELLMIRLLFIFNYLQN